MTIHESLHQQPISQQRLFGAAHRPSSPHAFGRLFARSWCGSGLGLLTNGLGLVPDLLFGGIGRFSLFIFYMLRGARCTGLWYGASGLLIDGLEDLEDLQGFQCRFDIAIASLLSSLRGDIL